MRKAVYIIAYIFFSISLFAQTEKFDIASYKAPAGWKKETKQTVVVYTKIKDAAFCILAVYQSRPANGSPEIEFNTEWQSLMVENAGVKDAPAIDKDKADGWELYIGKAKSKLDNGSEYMNVLTTFIGYGKVVSFVINYNDDLFKKDISNFFDNIQIAKNSAAANAPKTSTPQIPLKATAKLKGDIAGIWMGYENGDFIFGVTSYDYVNHQNNYGSKFSASAVSVKFRTFFNDGIYFDGVPFKGLHEFNINDPAYTDGGTYTIDKKLVTAKLTHYSSTIRLFTISGSGSMKYIDKYPFVKCKSVDGLKLSGTYISAAPMSIPYYKSLGKPLPSITFTSSGEFTDDHFIDDYNNEPALAPGSGTYQIIDYTIILNYSDGRVVQRCSFGFLNEDPKTCKIYYLNNQDIKLKPKE
jgi:hypothetical protein